MLSGVEILTKTNPLDKALETLQVNAQQDLDTLVKVLKVLPTDDLAVRQLKANAILSAFCPQTVLGKQLKDTAALRELAEHWNQKISDIMPADIYPVTYALLQEAIDDPKQQAFFAKVQRDYARIYLLMMAGVTRKTNASAAAATPTFSGFFSNLRNRISEWVAPIDDSQKTEAEQVVKQMLGTFESKIYAARSNLEGIDRLNALDPENAIAALGQALPEAFAMQSTSPDASLCIMLFTGVILFNLGRLKEAESWFTLTLTSQQPFTNTLCSISRIASFYCVVCTVLLDAEKTTLELKIRQEHWDDLGRAILAITNRELWYFNRGLLPPFTILKKLTVVPGFIDYFMRQHRGAYLTLRVWSMDQEAEQMLEEGCQPDASMNADNVEKFDMLLGRLLNLYPGWNSWNFVKLRQKLASSEVLFYKVIAGFEDGHITAEGAKSALTTLLRTSPHFASRASFCLWALDYELRDKEKLTHEDEQKLFFKFCVEAVNHPTQASAYLFNKQLHHDQRPAFTHLCYGYVCQLQGDYNQAIEQFKIAADESSGYYNGGNPYLRMAALRGIFSCHSHLGRYDAALKAAETAYASLYSYVASPTENSIQQTINNLVSNDRAFAYLLHGQSEKFYRLEGGGLSDDYEAYYQLYVGSGSPLPGQPLLRKSLIRWDVFLFCEAYVALLRGNNMQAKDKLDYLIKFHPYYANARMLRGMLSCDLNNTVAAAEDFTALLPSPLRDMHPRFVMLGQLSLYQIGKLAAPEESSAILAAAAGAALPINTADTYFLQCIEIFKQCDADMTADSLLILAMAQAAARQHVEAAATLTILLMKFSVDNIDFSLRSRLIYLLTQGWCVPSGLVVSQQVDIDKFLTILILDDCVNHPRNISKLNAMLQALSRHTLIGAATGLYNVNVPCSVVNRNPWLKMATYIDSSIAVLADNDISDVTLNALQQEAQSNPDFLALLAQGYPNLHAKLAPRLQTQQPTVVAAAASAAASSPAKPSAPAPLPETIPHSFFLLGSGNFFFDTRKLRHFVRSNNQSGFLDNVPADYSAENAHKL